MISAFVKSAMFLVLMFLLSCTSDNIVNSQYSNYNGKYEIDAVDSGGYFNLNDVESISCNTDYIIIGDYKFKGSWDKENPLKFSSIYDGPNAYNSISILQVKFDFFEHEVAGTFKMIIQEIIDGQVQVGWYIIIAQKIK